MTAPTLTLTDDAVRPVAQGHPWVWREGVLGSAPAGTLVRLVDGRGVHVAWGLADDGAVAVRVLGRAVDPLPRLIEDRIARAVRLRARVVPPDTDAYRLINGEGDGLSGVVVDRYGPVLVLRLYARAWEAHLGLLVAALRALEGVGTVYRRLGVGLVDGERGGVTLAGSPVPQTLVVRERGVRFLVRPEVGQKTGLFLDQRENRRRVGELARDAEVVNLFGYNGGFTVTAALGGARRVVTVDVAGDALEDARENLRLNGVDPGSHPMIEADAFRWRPDRAQDLVVCDPPSLTHGARSDGQARGAYRDLASLAGAMVAEHGLLATASCTARLTVSRWEEAIREGVRKVGRWRWLEHAEAPADHPVAVGHPEGRYLKFALLARS